LPEEKAGFSVEPVWEAFSTTALVNALKQGIGVAVLPYRMVIGPLSQGKVIELKPAGLDFNRNFNIIYQKHKHLTTAAKNFIQLCMDYESDYPPVRYEGLD